MTAAVPWTDDELDRVGSAEELEVASLRRDGEINDAVDAAYRTKYGRYSANTIQRITSATAGSTTMRLLPR